MNAPIFLVDTLFNLYLMVVLLRLWLQLVKADFYNPFSQFVVKLTNPVLRPLRRIIPGVGGFDLASLVLALIVAAIKISLLAMMGRGMLDPGTIAFGAFMTVLGETFSMLTIVLIVRAVLSWISQGHNPIEAVLHQLTEPMVAPIRRIIPPIGGLDLSLMVLLIGLYTLQIMVNDMIRAFIM